MNNCFTLFSIGGVLLALATQSAAGSTPALRIGWIDLRPAGQREGQLIAPAAASDHGRELSSSLNGQTIEITGFLIPADRDGNRVYDFMLVPFAGACSHAAQPPPNQVVRVTPQEAFEADGIYQVVTVKGTLQSGFDKAQLFILDGARVVESGYHIGSAEVRKADHPGQGVPQPSPSPWKFLKQ